jgi:hypothetical protein
MNRRDRLMEIAGIGLANLSQCFRGFALIDCRGEFVDWLKTKWCIAPSKLAVKQIS